VVSTVATLIGVCALMATFWQTRIMRDQLHASVWPRLNVSHGFFTDPARAFYRLEVENAGIGPAIIKGVSVKYRGVEVHDMISFLEKLAAEEHIDPAQVPSLNHSDPIPDQVLPPQQRVVLLEVKGQPCAKAIKAALKQLEMTITYTSIYGEAWEAGYPRRTHRAVGWIKE
jgi:hypothetical protein